MNYKEKYEMALETVQEILDSGSDSIKMSRLKLRLQTVFPELKESEDENIRESIIGFLVSITSLKDGQTLKNEDFDTKVILEWVAWLKKQGEHANFRNSIQIGDEVTRNEDGVLVNLSQLRRVAKKDEKQGEQVSIDKVEPKFKVGDWIITPAEDVLQITSIKGTKYEFNNVHNEWYNWWEIRYCDEQCHLWTIEDAKDGDVLRLGYVTAMFKKYIGQETCICYCSICKDGYLEIPIEDGNDNIYGCTNATPATKEQRDLLFQRMKEAGYEWDTDKKELIKQMTDEERKQDMLVYQGEAIYDMSFEKAQDYINKRGFDIPWNDGDVMIDERKLTQTVANVLNWADRHPLVLPDKKE